MNTFRSWSRRAWLLHGYLIAALTILPVQFARSGWIDTDSDAVVDTWDIDGIYYTLADLDAISIDIDNDGAYNNEELAYGSNPFDLDTDDDGLNDGDEIHLAGSSPVTWDSDGNEVSDFDQYYGSSSVTYPGGALPAYDNASYSDYDGDGIKNPFDTYPADPYNNDADGDLIDDSVDPVLGDASNYSSANGYTWGSDALQDNDNDNIANFWDEFPYDSSNGSIDSDGDGIDNISDPFPNDYSNFSWVNGIYWNSDVFGDADMDWVSNYEDAWPYDASNGAGDPGGETGYSNDDDGDGIENDFDPAPNDPDNYSDVNGTAWYWYPLEDADEDGQANFYDPYPNDTYDNMPDFDGDGWNNEEDPFPKDNTNYSELNQTTWGAYLFDDPDGDGLSNWQDHFPNDPYNGDPDFDADTILNGDDPYPTDGANFSDINQIAWGSNALGDNDGDGILNWQDESPDDTNTTTNDADGDLIDDSIDPNSADSSNYSPYNYMSWGADALGDNDNDGTLNYYDCYPNDAGNNNGDGDGDGISDSIDPAPGDSSNHSFENNTSWYGDALGDADYDGIVNYYDYQPYGDSEVDTDGDGIFDTSDPAPSDPTNYSYINGLCWHSYALYDDDDDGIINFEDPTPSGPPPVDGDGDGLSADEETSYGTSDSDPDTDDDGLTDGEEVHMFTTDPTNAYSRSQSQGLGDLYTDWEMVDLTDSDDDDIPDRIELHYNLNPNWPLDALLDRDNDGMSNIDQYYAGIALDLHLSTYDSDGDGMTDVFEDAYAQVLSKLDPQDAVEDADGDGVLNYEEQRLLVSPNNPDTLQLGGLGDLQWLMLGIRYPDGSDPPDTDTTPANGIPDWADALMEGPSAPDNYHFARSSPTDLDGDGMPDAWEHQYGRWKYGNGLQIRVDDAEADNDGDNLSNVSEYILGTSPLAGDTDGNNVNDEDEDFDGDGLTNGQEIALGTNAWNIDSDGDGIDDKTELTEGTDPIDPDSSSALLIALSFRSPVE